MTNVNPGNRDPRKGRLGGSRKFFSRDKSDDLLQDRDDLADNLAQDPAAERYETAGDGTFDEALDEYYDSRSEGDFVQEETAPLGKHHRRENEVAGLADDDYVEVVDADPAETKYRDFDAPAGTSDAYYAEGYGSDPGAYENYEHYENNEAYGGGEGDYRDYEGYDDRAAVVAPAAATAKETGAASTRTSATAGGSSSAAAAGGVPKRGLAMILIAVALLLALWGVYAMTKGSSDNQAANDPANQSAQDANTPNGQGQNGQGQVGQNPNDPNAQGQQASGQNPNDPNAQGQQASGQNPNGQSGAAPAGANRPMTPENQTVNVYNNSAINGFADQVAGQVGAKGTKVGEVGNIPGEAVTFEQNTVLYDPATPDAERYARELADKVGGVAVPADDRIPAAARKPGSLTLVLAENRPVNI
ncbi:LytR C-terminal domain-containing protein [Corynebacterium sp. P3-F1]|uniref:LytR C-terminal domain-containing protein n=1 Tax=Corynebacterium sp. P3-F1 TaxID=3059080 RepID=UPI00265CE99E|nr:LytR C-terminal domain-containing protein [Corynebacterium sp. P3-F1]WKK62179.1 LytR C-terminal domain-containing protein [Corynebacterium sp. P3-F1]